MRLAEKRALVGGSGRGIGRAIAVRFAREGRTSSSTTSTSEARRDRSLAEVEATGRRGVLIQADLSRTDEACRLIDEVFRVLGPLDILVNNAGIERRPLSWRSRRRITTRSWKRQPQGGLLHHPGVRAAPACGRAAGQDHPDQFWYTRNCFAPALSLARASKGGLQLLTRDLAVELGEYKGITVNGIALGAIATEINRALLDDKPRVDRLLKQVPLGRMGKPEDVAAVAAFLASSDADYVTGSTYYVDGGLAWNYRE